MSSGDKIVVAGIKLRTDRPTNVKLDDLYGWVIWQFPRPQKAGYCGAVRPPSAEHKWFPALILTEKNRVQVYGNLDKQYSTPERAVNYFQEKESS